MNVRNWSVAALGLAAVALVELRTDYAAERSLTYTSSMEMEVETTSMRMERDGQPIEMPGGGGGMGMSESSEVTWTDTVIEHKDGAPTKLKRVFGALEGSTTMSFGGEDQTRERKGALDGVTLELSLDEEGKVVAEVKDGDAPGEALVGHHLTLALDAFLPEGDVADGDSWELEKETIRRGLGLDLATVLFQPPQDGGGGSGGGEGGSRRGPRGPRGGMAGAVLMQAELEGKATLSEDVEEVDGQSLRVIKLEITASGSMEDPGMGGGGRGRGRAFEPASPTLVETTYSIELEGQLLFDPQAKLPSSLSIDGTFKVESRREGEFQGTSFKSESTQEGDIKFSATVTTG
ncbi:MAG: hypothetical protein FJ298_12555 [Planctomycetes bacterium]|nr:hypothetical protein [Planctomycetota bacterium]